jgi:hypothetical protein
VGSLVSWNGLPFAAADDAYWMMRYSVASCMGMGFERSTNTAPMSSSELPFRQLVACLIAERASSEPWEMTTQGSWQLLCCRQQQWMDDIGTRSGVYGTARNTSILSSRGTSTWRGIQEVITS